MTQHTINRNDTYQRVTDEVIKHLEKGVAIWQQGWNSLGLPKNIITGKVYRGWNVYWLNFATIFSGYKTPYFLTFKQAAAAGGRIKKGEKGHYIVYWATVESKTRLASATSSEAGEETHKTRTRLIPKGHIVFNIDQTEGIDFPLTEKIFRSETEKIDSCEKIVAEMPQCPPMRFGGDKAFYHRVQDFVQLPNREQFKTSEHFYKTLFHELAHSSGHQSRLNRKELVNSDGFGNELYSKEELTAELCAAFLCAVCGIEQPVIENSAAYLQNWLEALKNDKTLILKAAAQAQKASDFILNIKQIQEEVVVEQEMAA
jgi:antirestriction protein ArdC